MAQPFRFSKLLACFLAAATSAAEASSDDQAFLNFLADQQAQIQRDTASARVPAFSVSSRDTQDAQAIAIRTQNDTLTAIGGDKAPGKYQQFRTLVFITLGMPEKTLRALFRQGANRRDIGFVLRGMTSSDLYREMKRIRDLMSHDGEANVFVDPLLFQNYRIDRAPFTLHKANDGRWYGLWGEIAVDGARERIEQGLGGRNRPPVGPVYALKEPDMHEQMRKKFEAADWSKIAENARQRAAGTSIDVTLPVANEDRVRLVDVSTKLARDILGPNGEVLPSAGTIINPLEHIALDEQYIVFDPTNRAEAAIVAQWRQQYPSAKLLVTHWDTRLGAKFDIPVYVLDPLFKRRFSIERTPSLVEQDGHKMRVSEKRVRP